MTAMPLFALQLSLLEACLRLIRATLASCLGRFPLHRLPLIRERLLRLGAHRQLPEGLRRLAGAPLGVLRGLACFSGLVAEERELRPFAYNESQDLLIGRLRAEDDAGGAVPSALDVLRQPDSELAVVIYGQGGRHADLHGWFLLYVDDHAEKGQPRRQVTDADSRTPTTTRRGLCFHLWCSHCSTRECAPTSLPTWRDRDSLFDTSFCILSSRFRNFKTIRVSKPRRRV